MADNKEAPISTRIDDLRLIVPPGQKPAQAKPGGANAPSFEYPEVEDHRDVEVDPDDFEKDPKPSSGDEEYDKLLDDYDNSSTAENDLNKDAAADEAEKDRSGKGKGKEDQDGKGEKGDGEGKDGKEGGDDQEGDDPNLHSAAGKGMGNKEIKLHKAGDIHVLGEMIKPGSMTARDMDIWRAKAAEQRQRAIHHPKFGANALKKPIHRQTKDDAGFGLMGEFGAVGYTPPQTGIWKRVFKNWIASIIEEKPGPSWFRQDLKTRVIRNQLMSRGHQTKMKNPDAPGGRPHKFRIHCFVDVSGSVFNMKIQSEFAKILRGVPPERAEVLIWTFDSDIQEGPFSPKRFNPKRGGGGTEAFESVGRVLADPKYKNPDGCVFLTDGEFTSTPFAATGLSPKKVCFILTKRNSKQHIPGGCKILDTSIEEGSE